jgi:ubiquinol-cytochrome c reductase cytochrome b subunit
MLGWIGGKPVESYYYIAGQVCTAVYFLFFIVLLPIIAELELRNYHTSIDFFDSNF